MLSVLERNWRHRNLFLSAEINFCFGLHLVNFSKLYHGLSNILKIYCQLILFLAVPSLLDLPRDTISLFNTSHKSELSNFSFPFHSTLQSRSWLGMWCVFQKYHHRNCSLQSPPFSILTLLNFLLTFNVHTSSEKREETIWSKLLNANSSLLDCHTVLTYMVTDMSCVRIAFMSNVQADPEHGDSMFRFPPPTNI